METVNGCLSDRLDEMEAAIRKTSFRKGTGRANEVNYWVFDYPPEKELGSSCSNRVYERQKCPWR